MNVIRWIVWAAVFLLILLLAFDNADTVTLRFFGLASVQLPLILVVFVAFALGVTFGLIAGSLNVARARREMKKAQKELKKREKDSEKERERASIFPVEESVRQEESNQSTGIIAAEPVEAEIVGEAKPDKNN